VKHVNINLIKTLGSSLCFVIILILVLIISLLLGSIKKMYYLLPKFSDLLNSLVINGRFASIDIF